MIIGQVSGNYEGVIPISLANAANWELHEFDAIIDTGLNYYLALPRSVVEQLELPIQGSESLTMGNEQGHEFDRAFAVVDWDGIVDVFPALVSESEILVGARLLAGYYLTAAMVPGGRVTLTKLP